MAVVRNVVVRIGADIGDLQRSLNDAQSQLKKFGSAMTSAGSYLTAGLTVPIAGIGVASIKAAADFEQGMSNIKAVSGATGKEMSQLKELALKMGADTKYSAKEAASGIEELIKAGVSTEQILKGGLQGALSLAAAGELELGEAAEIASTALNAFKRDNLSVIQAADILAGAANASATSVKEMKYSLAAVSAVASSVGMSFKDTSTAIAVFAQNGLKGSDAGTSLKTMLMNLQPSTKEQIATFKKLGLVTDKGASKFFNAKGQLRGLNEIAGELQRSMGGMTDAQRLSTMETMFGSDAIRAANILYSEGAQGVNKMQSEMSKTTATQVATEKMNNFNGSLEQLKGSLETLGIKLGELFLPYLKQAADYLTKLTNSFITLDPNLQKAIVVFALVAASIGPLLMSIGLMASGVGALSGAFSAILGVLGGISIGFIAIVAAAAVMIGMFAYLWTTNEEFRTNMTNAWNAIKQSLSDIWNSIKDTAVVVWDALKVFWNTWGTDVSGLFKAHFEGIAMIIKGACEVISGIFNIFAGIFTGDWNRVWTGVKQIFEGIWTMIKGNFNLALTAITKILSTAWAFIEDKILKPVYDWIKDTFGPIFNKVYEIFEPALNDINTFIGNIFGWIKEAILAVYNWLNDTFKPIFNDIATVLGLAWGALAETVKKIWDGAMENMKPFFDWVDKTLKPVFDAVKGALDTAWGGLEETVKTIWAGIWLGVKTGINNVIGGINAFLGAIRRIKIEVPSVSLPGGGKIGGYSIGMPQIPDIPKLETGTNFVPDDMVAMLHKGEAVVPEKYNNGRASSNNPIVIYLDGTKIYEGVDKYMGSRLVSLGRI